MEIKQADLILVRGDAGLAHAIEHITHSPYSHVAGLCKPNELIEAQGFRPTGYQGLDFYAGCADVYRCEGIKPWQRAQIVANVERYIGRRYSYLLIGWELLRYSLGVVIVPGKDWDPIVCSTVWINEGYRKAGIDPSPGIRFPTPGDIAKSSMFRKIGSI